MLPAVICAQETTQPQDKIKTQYAAQIESIQKAITAENKNIEGLTLDLFKARQMKLILSTELGAYRLHLSTLGNLLLLQNAKLDDLEKASGDHRVSVTNVDERLKDLKKKLESLDLHQKQAEEQYRLNKKHLEDLKKEKSVDSDANALILNFQYLLDILVTKQELLKELGPIYSTQIDQLDSVKTDFLDLSKKLDQTIKDIKKQELFQSKGNLLVMLTWKQVREETSYLSQRAVSLLSKGFWAKELKVVWRVGGFLIVSSILLYTLILFLIIRLRNFCLSLQNLPFFSKHPVRTLAYEIFLRSLPLFGSTLFIYIYAQVQFLYASIPLVQAGVNILWTLLISRWYLDFLKLRDDRESAHTTNRITPAVKFLIRYVRTFAIAHLVIGWLISGTGIILFLVRMAFEIGIIVWQIRFLKSYTGPRSAPESEPSPRKTITHFPLSFMGYFIGGVALLLELTGYGPLAVYWLSSWGHSSAVLLWGSIFFFILREWYQGHEQPVQNIDDGDKITGHPFRFIIIWVCWLMWFGSFVLSLIIAWGGRQTVIFEFFRLLQYPFAVGNMRFSLLGFIYASLILLFTHATVKTWRRFFKNKILAHSGLEIGLQESITTIAAYVFWALGILFALHAFGLNTTSLAVAFGALGIGLGFGLQAIFNNFVSGIILLFERPIQVGDAIEINGIWATVKRINVRSTVVQTWDNASLIIPNSEFISTQVTNWSFSDMRLRRNINVGVEYGSDVELVRETLLGVAENTPRVLKYPKPDVLFTDFGDSALIFRLRVWTVIDHMLAVETAIRFEIDRLFRERGITIAFPQRDIHIRSISNPLPFEPDPKSENNE